MKRLLVAPGMAVVLFLGGCLPSIGPEKDKVIQENEKVEETVMIPDIQLKDEYYRTLLPFKKSATRGLVVKNIYTKYDIQEAEEGLMRLSAQHFDPKNHFFQEGQFIDKKTASAWLARSTTNADGLNPPEATGKDAEVQPIYLAHIIEQNYLTMTDERKVSLSGISIGLALNSVYYSRDGKQTTISDKELEKQGMDLAEIIVSRLRAKEGFEDIPIVVGLFKQEKRNSIVPGTYFATAFADKGKSAPSGWKEVNERYVLLPATSDIDNYREINTRYSHFKQDIDKYFPSFVNVIGTGYFKEGRMQSLQINVPIQFFGKAEIIGFTQFMTELVKKYYPNIDIEVSITSVNGPEALIVKIAGEEEYVHIYGY
ncbi:CamS family sex pheromone protein [Sporosarcina highlanderae]|uniref:CamS family sex pheromone protein n=1 Tax=Sporosarcina highlanderae TaxID=3035916 RepID=A0ABT8JVA1_9BACL|nr:CamS family sex pheromone protein [Sporosarcina highlanderae]MDN4608297.1 CamS family sex pheromone protein [Sporosarcina highlanderae]